MSFFLKTLKIGLASVKTPEQEFFYRILLLEIRSYINDRNAEFDRRLMSFFDTAISGSALYLDRLPDFLLERLKESALDVAEDGCDVDMIKWSDLGEWGVTYYRPHTNENEQISSYISESALSFAALIADEITFRANWRHGLECRERIVRLLVQSIRDRMEYQIGWTSYAEVTSWFNAHNLRSFQYIVEDYRSPGRVRRWY